MSKKLIYLYALKCPLQKLLMVFYSQNNFEFWTFWTRRFHSGSVCTLPLEKTRAHLGFQLRWIFLYCLYYKSDVNNPDIYRYQSDYSQMTMHHWGPMQPKQNGAYFCLQFGVNYMWNVNCEVVNPYVCQGNVYNEYRSNQQ